MQHFRIEFPVTYNWNRLQQQWFQTMHVAALFVCEVALWVVQTAHLWHLSQAQNLAIFSIGIGADEQGCRGWGHRAELLQGSIQSLQELAIFTCLQTDNILYSQITHGTIKPWIRKLQTTLQWFM